MKTKYYIHWDYGFHRLIIETTKRDFEYTINNMSTEFTIYKNTIKAKRRDGAIITYTDYKIQNYCGDPEIIGQTKTVEKGE